MMWIGIQKSYYKKLKVEKRHETARAFYLRADKDNENLKSALNIYEFVAYSGKDIADWHKPKMQQLNKEIRKNNHRYRRQVRKENKAINNIEPFKPID